MILNIMGVGCNEVIPPHLGEIAFCLEFIQKILLEISFFDVDRSLFLPFLETPIFDVDKSPFLPFLETPIFDGYLV